MKRTKTGILRFLSVIPILAMCIGMLSVPMYASDLPFIDVSTGSWYYNDVKSAYEKSLINGKTATTYEPDSNLTYAEAVKLASCMYQNTYEGRVLLENGTPWYQNYVDYAKGKGIILKDYDWNAKATRAGYMEIFSGALKSTELQDINTVADGSIPDVPMTHPQAGAIYKLYRAGIVQGSDAARSAKPDDNIKRSEVAAILTRMMDEDARILFAGTKPAEKPEEKPADSSKDEKTGDSSNESNEDKTTAEQGKLLVSVDKLTVNVDSDKFFSVIATASGGAGEYDYSWYFGSTTESMKEMSEFPSTPSLSMMPDPSYKTQYLKCRVKDKDGNEAFSPVITINVNIIKAAAEEEPELEVYDELRITEQPQDAVIELNDSADFYVEVKGGKKPYSYNWRMEGDGWSNLYTGSDSYRFDADNINFDGTHIWCEITDDTGNVITSETAVITVTEPFRIKEQSQDEQVFENDDFTLFVSVSGGTKPYKYSWFSNAYSFTYGEDMGGGYISILDNSTVSGAEKSDLTISPAAMQDEGEYFCRITDADGNMINSDTIYVEMLNIVDTDSSSSTSTVRPSRKRPLRATVDEEVINLSSYDEEFTVTAHAFGGTISSTSGRGVRPIRNTTKYSWYFGDSNMNFTEITSYNPNFPTTSSVTAKPDARYKTQYMKCKVTRGTEEVFSPVITINIDSGLKVTQHPKTTTVKVTESAVFTAAVSGGKPPYKYQWYLADQPTTKIAQIDNDPKFFSGTNTDTLKVTAKGVKTYSDLGYYCIVTDSQGNTVPTALAKAILLEPRIYISTEGSRLVHIDNKRKDFILLDGSGSSTMSLDWTATNTPDNGSTYAMIIEVSYDNTNFEQWAQKKHDIKRGATGTYTFTIGNESSKAPIAYRIKLETSESGNYYSNVIYVINPLTARYWVSDDYSQVSIAGGIGPFTYKWDSYDGNNKFKKTILTLTTDSRSNLLTAYDVWQGKSSVLNSNESRPSKFPGGADVFLSTHVKASNWLGRSYYVCTVTDALGQSIFVMESTHGNESKSVVYDNPLWESWEDRYEY